MKRVRRVKKEQPAKSKTHSEIVADVITASLEPKYCTLTGRRPKDCTNEHVYSKYKHVFDKIATYLLELRGDYKNSFESLSHDYLLSIYKRFGYYSKTPFLTQLSPSQNNQEKFEEWVHQYEEKYSTNYWTEVDIREKSLEIAKKHIAMSRNGIAESQDNFDIHEI